MKNTMKYRIIAMSLTAFLSLNMYTSSSFNTVQVKADSVSDLENLKEENNKKIRQLQDEISSAQGQFDILVKDETAKKQYVESLNEKIDLQNQNIEYVKNQITQIDADITDNQAQIEVLKVKIADKNTDIDKNIELFKERLRASYMSGDSTIAAVFSGSADFYDILAKYELVCKVAEHDDELINTLKTDLQELSELNETLTAKQNELDAALADSIVKKDELSEVLSELTTDYQQTEDELVKLGEQKSAVSIDINAKQIQADAEQAEHDKIVSQIASAKEAIKKAQESSIAASKKESEEASRKAEEANKKKQTQTEKQEIRQTQAPAVTQPPETAAPTAEPPETQPPETQPPATEAPSVSAGLEWPVPGYYKKLTSDYGYRSFDNSFHRGVDISGGGIAGAAIVAADSGVVVSVSNSCTHNYSKDYSCGCGGGYGNYLIILHNDGTYSTLYGHCQSIIVSAGQSVSKGQTIAYVGTTGYSTGYHLHFEVLKNGSNIDPMSFFP